MHNLYSANQGNAKRLTAHRQTWFSTNAVNMTPSGKQQTEDRMARDDRQAESRWVDQYGEARSSVTILDLIESENARAREVTALLRSGDTTTAEKLANKPSPLAVLNDVLRAANLSIEIEIEKGQKLFARKNGGARYSIAELSDGERNAFLIGARVLTVPPGTLLIIDEPERHLHRAVASPLLLALFAERDDCAFVLSTHDVSLPADSPPAKVVILRSCTWNGNQISGWDADVLVETAALDDDIRRAILGSRRRILFVEGDYNSLDRRIYSALYPDLSIVPSGTCSDVERAVRGIGASKQLHWLSAFGLIDKDDRVPEEIRELEGHSIYALDACSVESLYYCSEIRKRIAERQAAVSEEIPNLNDSDRSILEEVGRNKERLCYGAVVRRVRRSVAKDLPTADSLQRDPLCSVHFDATPLIDEERDRFDSLLAAKDTDGLIDRYPVRETGALSRVASDLGFKTRVKCESAVIKLLKDDQDAKEILLQKLKSLTEAVSA